MSKPENGVPPVPAATGTLYLCGTPLGNLEDITLRVLRTLREVDLIAAEDTRRTAKLLAHFEISTPQISYREENRQTAGERIIAALAEGRNVALVSDAGMPGIADPGPDLVRRCRARHLQVVPVPGPASPLVALVASGFSAERFAFEGFLPKSRPHRRCRLLAISQDSRTLVFFLTPHRLVGALEEILEILGDRPALLARELTKKFEEISAGALSELAALAGTRPPRGEYTLVVTGCDEQELSARPAPSLQEALESLREQGLPRSRAARLAAAQTGVSRRQAYAQALAMSFPDSERSGATGQDPDSD